MDSLEDGNYLQALERLALSAWAFYEICNESGWNLKEDKNSAQFVGYD